MKDLGPRVRVKQVQALHAYVVRVLFENGVEREIDLAPYLRGPVFDPLRQDFRLFQSAKVEGGTIAWENGADIDPDVLYYGLTPAWMENESVRA
jgi:hypothetical protein